VSLSELNLLPPDEFPSPPRADSDTEALSPGEEEELEERAAQYHHHSPRLLKLLKSSSMSKPAVSSTLLNHLKFFPSPAVAQTVVCPLYGRL
jgi:hypothetical protein